VKAITRSARSRARARGLSTVSFALATSALLRARRENGRARCAPRAGAREARELGLRARSRSSSRAHGYRRARLSPAVLRVPAPDLLHGVAGLPGRLLSGHDLGEQPIPPIYGPLGPVDDPPECLSSPGRDIVARDAWAGLWEPSLAPTVDAATTRTVRSMGSGVGFGGPRGVHTSILPPITAATTSDDLLRGPRGWALTGPVASTTSRWYQDWLGDETQPFYVLNSRV
jgi:hypothetical protein